MRPESLSNDEARRLALRAQGLLGRRQRPKTAGAALRLVAALQLDTISVLARSHELVCYARLGPVGRDAVERACWGLGLDGWPVAVEYWGHAASILPVETWPWFAFRRRRYRNRGRWGHEVPVEVIRAVRHRLETEGPLTATELGGAKQGGPWWDWSPVKVAVERLLAWGDVVCVTRRGWKRVYDLAERALPDHVRPRPEPSDEECLTQLVRISGSRLGVATRPDLADYFRIRIDDVEVGLAGSGLVPVAVPGWGPAWADPAALGALGERGRHRTTLLSPFDSLIWDRARTARLFGFAHRLEAYTPAAKRVHGYYAMPVLSGGELIGRVDPHRQGSTLVAKQVSLRGPGALAGVAAALVEASRWVGASAIAVEAVEPIELAPALRAAIGSTDPPPFPAAP